MHVIRELTRVSDLQCYRGESREYAHGQRLYPLPHCGLLIRVLDVVLYSTCSCACSCSIRAHLNYIEPHVDERYATDHAEKPVSSCDEPTVNRPFDIVENVQEEAPEQTWEPEH